MRGRGVLGAARLSPRRRRRAVARSRADRVRARRRRRAGRLSRRSAAPNLPDAPYAQRARRAEAARSNHVHRRRSARGVARSARATNPRDPLPHFYAGQVLLNQRRARRKRRARSTRALRREPRLAEAMHRAWARAGALDRRPRDARSAGSSSSKPATLTRRSRAVDLSGHGRDAGERAGEARALWARSVRAHGRRRSAPRAWRADSALQPERRAHEHARGAISV